MELVERRIDEELEQQVERPGREGFRSLARKPSVQLLLAVTVGLQTMAVVAVPKSDRASGGLSVVAELEAIRVTPSDETMRAAWLAKSVERESQRLAAEYQSRGYKVTQQLARSISRAALENGIEPEVAFGLVRAESSFRNAATSPVGATGLTQLMPRTAAWMQPGVTRAQLRDPDTNLRVGMKYLRYLVDKYDGNERLALLAYNRGPGTVDKALKSGRNPDNGYADFVYGKSDHGHKLYTKKR